MLKLDAEVEASKVGACHTDQASEDEEGSNGIANEIM